MNHTNKLHFYRIKQLRMKNQLTMISSITLFVAALFVSAVLPSLLIRYFYADQQLFEQPRLLEMIPVVSFVIAFGYFLLALVGNFIRGNKAKMLERDLDTVSVDGCCGSGGCGDGQACCGGVCQPEDEMLAELEELVEKTQAKAKKAPVKKKAVSKTKKTTKSKKAKK